MFDNLAKFLLINMSALALIPPILYFGMIGNGVYFQDAFWSILYMMVSMNSLFIIFNTKLALFWRVVGMMVSGWFFIALVFAVAGFFIPSKIQEHPTDLYLWAKFSAGFSLGLGLTFIYEKIWVKHKS